jgi:hypothetical protein
MLGGYNTQEALVRNIVTITLLLLGILALSTAADAVTCTTTCIGQTCFTNCY